MATKTQQEVKQNYLEDKQEICSRLCLTLRMTSEYLDLIRLDYNDKSETVTATFYSGKKVINVAMDSGSAMIRDIVRGLQ